AGVEVIVNAPGGVGQERDAGPKKMGHMNWLGYAPPGVSLIVMQPAFKKQHPFAHPVGDGEETAVPSYRRHQHSWYVTERAARLRWAPRCHAAHPRTEHEGGV